MANRELKYKATDKMAEIICENASLLQVMSRFGMSLGIGDCNVQQVCRMQGVDYKTFIAVINFVSEDYTHMEEDVNLLSVSALLDYLKQSHIYFLDFALPNIRCKLTQAIDTKDDVSALVLRFFDDYMAEVRKHMEYEEKEVFPFVEALLQGEKRSSYKISTFSKHHNPIDEKLNEFKNIIIKYYPAKGSNNLINSILFDVFSCEQELKSHCKIEDYLFVPAVMNLEKQL